MCPAKEIYKVEGFDACTEIERRKDWLKNLKDDEFLKEIDSCGLPPKALAVDVGCGIGRRTALLAGHRRVGSVIGIDIHDALLKEAGEYFRVKRITNVRLMRNDAYNLDIADQTVDLVRCDSVLWTTRTPLKVLGEIKRILKPGGKFILTNHDSTGVEHLSHPPYPRAYSEFSRKFNSYLKSCGADTFVGHKLASLCLERGLKVLEAKLESSLDLGPLSPAKVRQHWSFVEEWAPQLLEKGIVQPRTLKEAKRAYGVWATRPSLSLVRLKFKVTGCRP